MYFKPRYFLLIILFTTSVITSCILYSPNGIEVQIKNNSDKIIQNVVFSTTENLDSLMFYTIKPGEKVKGFLSLKETKSDGSYTLVYEDFQKNKFEIERGYYTNGGSSDNLVEFDIRKDTSFVKFDKPKY